MKYRYILFDLDGTLTDPEEGITRSFACALEKFGITDESREALRRVIGPPLLQSERRLSAYKPSEFCLVLEARKSSEAPVRYIW